MSVFKQFLAQDITITPFKVNKYFYCEGVSGSSSAIALDGAASGIDRFAGKNLPTLFDSASQQSGTLSNEYFSLVYNSIKQLYYSNFLSASYGDNIYTASLTPGRDKAGDIYLGSPNSTGRYENYLQSTLTASRYFSTESNSRIVVISIPSRLFGDNIQPGSFFMKNDTGSIYDDGEGNIYASGSGTKVDSLAGNIIYQHGLIILTSGSLAPDPFLNSYISNNSITCSFSSSYTIYETQYKCNIRESEFNHTLNSSAISSSNGLPYNNITGSDFQPYVTTVGLYNDRQELLMVAKLAQPLPISHTTDTNIIINIDR